MERLFVKYLKFSLLMIISFTILFIIVKTNFSSEKSFSINQIQDTTGWVQLEELPYGIKNHITKAWTSGGVNYLVLAGGRINDSISSSVILVRVSPRAYLQLPSLPFPIEKAGGFIIKDSLYVVGGSSDTTTNNFRETVFKLNLENPVSWQQKNNMPNKLSEITFGTAALNDSVVYVAGGRDSTGIQVHSCLMYNPIADTWTETQNPLPYKAYGVALGIVNDSTLILIGGRKTDFVYDEIYRGELKKTEPDKIRWDNLQSYPPGPVYNIGCWGTKSGIVMFTGGTNSLYPGNSSDSAYASTYAYVEKNRKIVFVNIRPSPITHTQLDGFIIPGPDTLINCLTAGGANTPWGPGIKDIESLTLNPKNVTIIIKIIPENNIPDKIFLYQNYPNPFNPVTKIKFSIPKSKFRSQESDVRLVIYDLLGKEIKILTNEKLQPGTYEVTFDADNLPSGIYFYRIIAGDYINTKKLVLLK